jgi:hypothetical protein
MILTRQFTRACAVGLLGAVSGSLGLFSTWRASRTSTDGW